MRSKTRTARVLFPQLESLVSDRPAGSFLVTMLTPSTSTDPDPLLARLERDLVLLSGAGWNIDKTGNTKGLLRGDDAKFYSGAAEVVAFGWFASRGLLRDVDVALAAGEAASGKNCHVEGAVGLPRGTQALFDVKSLQAHVQGYIDKLCETVETEVAARRLKPPKLSLHITGSPDVEHVRQNKGAIFGAAIAAIPKMLHGETPIWTHASFRLRGQLKKHRVQSGFQSVDGSILRRQEMLWKQCRQASTKRPFLLVLVRTDGMGIEVSGMADTLERSLKRYPSSSRMAPLFGTSSTQMVAKVGRTMSDLQRYVSGVLLIDARSASRRASQLFVNTHAAHPMSRGLLRALRR